MKKEHEKVRKCGPFISYLKISMSTILLFLTTIFILLTKILVKKKKKCYNDFS